MKKIYKLDSTGFDTQQDLICRDNVWIDQTSICNTSRNLVMSVSQVHGTVKNLNKDVVVLLIMAYSKSLKGIQGHKLNYWEGNQKSMELNQTYKWCFESLDSQNL